MTFVSMEAIEPNQPLVESVKTILEGLKGEEELVDLIHTTVLAAAMSKTDEGRRTQASLLVGVLGLAVPILGEEYSTNMVESANELAAVVMMALVQHQEARCKSCQDKGQCLDEEPQDPTIH